MGWVGRVVARTAEPPPTYTLAVPEETTTELGARWAGEGRLRLSGEGDLLVVALGANDLINEVSLARSRLYLANILDVACISLVSPFVFVPQSRSVLDLAAYDE